MVRALDLQLKRSWVRISTVPLSTLGKLFTLEVHRYCFARLSAGRLSAPNNRPMTDFLFQDASSFNKSHVVTIVKSQWYDGRFVTLLL